MSAFDYLPHRLLLNTALRKSADQLRADVDSCQEEYEERTAICKAEIEELDSRLEGKRGDVRAALEQELKAYEAELAGLTNDVCSYSDCALRLKYLYEERKLRAAIVDIYDEDSRFLSQQMTLIGEEVELLRVRKDELSSLVAIDDFVELSRLSCGELGIEGATSCEELLETVSAKLDGLPSDHGAERLALTRLSSIIQERAEYLPLIQYVEWVIRQKIVFSKELKQKRDSVNSQLGEAKRALDIVKRKISATRETQDALAEKVRMHWAAPLARLNAEINYLRAEKNSAWDDMKRTEGDINHMKDVHSSDQFRWNSLQRKHDCLYSRYEQLKQLIPKRVNSRKRLHNIGSRVLSLCKDNGVTLKGDGNKGKDDERRFIVSRLQEIEQIRSDALIEASADCEAERQRIAADRDVRLDDLGQQRDEAEAALRERVRWEDDCLRELNVAQGALEAKKSEDKRFFLLKLFDSPEITSAKQALGIARARYAAAREQRAAAESDLKKLDSTITEEKGHFEEMVARCRPRPSRPSTNELEEEKMLKLYLETFEVVQ